MTTTEPTTCTGCGKRYDAPIMVAAFSQPQHRLCQICTKRIADDQQLASMEEMLATLKTCVAGWEHSIAAHKAAHPPLVEDAEPEFLEMDGPMTRKETGRRN